MRIRLLIGLLLLVPQLTFAGVFMCVDPNSGKTSFTDKACATNSLREEIKVAPTNLDSGRRYVGASPAKTWRSEEDRRKSGLDYTAERRRLYESRATASAE